MDDFSKGVQATIIIFLAFIVLASLPGWLAAVIIIGGLVGAWVISEIKQGGFK